MYYVYQIQSISHPDQKYTGYTTDLKIRMKVHNEGRCPHTSKFIPWNLVNYFAFSDESKAKKFELYLKSGSGRAFSAKHF